MNFPGEMSNEAQNVEHTHVLPDRSYKTQLLSVNIQRRFSLPTGDSGHHAGDSAAAPGTYASFFQVPNVPFDRSSLPRLGMSYREACMLSTSRYEEVFSEFEP